jgi:hypothetical protein
MIATAAVASSDGQKPPAPRPTTEPTIHDDDHVADCRQCGCEGHQQCPVEEKVDLQQPVAQHRDGNADWDSELPEAQRQRR